MYQMQTSQRVTYPLIPSKRSEFSSRLDLHSGRYIVYVASGRVGQHRTLRGAEATVNKHSADTSVHVYIVEE